jgi:molybdopterin-guanine dinucleotide biosynthesis protein A
MGVDKATLELDGSTLAVRLARLLAETLDDAVEVGPGYSNLRSVQEQPLGSGPLVAIATAFVALGRPDALLALAVDMPFIDAGVLRLLRDHPSDLSAGPIWDGHLQPLCARWSHDALVVAESMVQNGSRSLRDLRDAVPVFSIDESELRAVVRANTLRDADTPEEWKEVLAIASHRGDDVATVHPKAAKGKKPWI